MICARFMAMSGRRQGCNGNELKFKWIVSFPVTGNRLLELVFAGFVSRVVNIIDDCQISTGNKRWFPVNLNFDEYKIL